MNRLLKSAALSLAIGAAALSPSLAQMTDQSPAKMGMMGGNCPTMSMMGMMGPGMMNQGMTSQGMGGQGTAGQATMGGQVNMGAMAEGRLAYLKAELNITDAQLKAWDVYVDAIKARVAAMQGMRQGMIEAMQTGNMMQRMDARISGMEAMLNAMKTVKPAADGLYAVLTDEQKQKADQLIGMDCGGM